MELLGVSRIKVFFQAFIAKNLYTKRSTEKNKCGLKRQEYNQIDWCECCPA